MNIFISGSTSILASAIIESYFDQDANLFIKDDLPEDESKLAESLAVITSKHTMDIVLLLDSDEIFNTPLTKRCLNSVPTQKIKQTKAICQYFAAQQHKPKALLLASSIAIYSSSEQSISAENSELGNNFIANYFKELESATRPAEENGIRVLHLRFGNILSKLSIPAYPRLPFFHCHITNIWQDKKRWTSWISCEDATRTIRFLLENEAITSPVNITSGRAVSKKDFLDTIAEKFHYSRTVPIPIPLLSLLFGPHKTSLFSVSTNSVPEKLMKAGFSFENTSMQEYLKDTEDVH